MWDVNRRAKTLLGFLLYNTPLYRTFWKNRALVVLFHRVDDRFPHDPLSCSVRRFQAYCEFFRRHFVVISLGELLERLRDGRDITRCLVITFDDGYLDNRRTAAVELKRNRLPACFFVTTGYIGSSRNAWWDTYRRVTSEWMSWDDVRALHADGFEVGVHGATHVDLGITAGNRAVEEITVPKRHLERELAAPVQHFGYPFGRARQLSEENRALVQSAGYRSCLSAFGGTVRPGCDAHRLPRTSVDDWYLSPYQFGLEVALRDE